MKISSPGKFDLLSSNTVLEPSTRDSNAHLCELTRRIDNLTQRQIRDLQVIHDFQKVTLNGRSKSYYIKQLASQAVIDLLPGIALENAIDVFS